MFRVSIPFEPYADPWLQGFEQRLGPLRARRRGVAYYYEAPNNSTFRYRAYNMVQVLNAAAGSDVGASYFFQDDLPRVDEVLEATHTLVICRSGYNHRLAALVERARRRGCRILFDVDDLVFDTRYTHLVVDTLALDTNDPRVWDDWFGMMARMGATLDLCDGAITTNEFLAARLHDRGGLPVAVVPNFMNREQLAFSDALYAHKHARGFERDETIAVGYFSGSPSHRLDYALVEPALEALLQRRPEVRLVTVGYIEPGPRLARHAHRIQREPFVDWVNLQRLLSTVEINLMPLQSNAFTDCKSELKFFEAAAVGTLSVASPSYTYRRAIEPGRTGWLARAHAWDEVLEQALQALPRYPALAADAREAVRQRYGWEHQHARILQALGLAPAAAP